MTGKRGGGKNINFWIIYTPATNFCYQDGGRGPGDAPGVAPERGGGGAGHAAHRSGTGAYIISPRPSGADPDSASWIRIINRIPNTKENGHVDRRLKEDKFFFSDFFCYKKERNYDIEAKIH